MPTLRAAHLPAPPDFLHVGRAALQAGLIDRFIPGREVAVGVPLAPEEGAPLLRSLLDDLALAALGARHADPRQERSRVPALREPRARQELAVPPQPDHHRPPALLAGLARRLVLQPDAGHTLLGL